MRPRSLVLVALAALVLAALVWLAPRGEETSAGVSRSPAPPLLPSSEPGAPSIPDAPIEAAPDPSRASLTPSAQGHVVFGRVIDPQGRAVAGAEVKLLRRADLQFAGTTATDDEGRFQFRDPEGDTFLMTVREPSFLPLALEVSADGAVGSVTLGVGPGVHLHTRWPDGTPAANATIRVRGIIGQAAGGELFDGTAFERQWTLYSWPTTDAGGRVFVRGDARGPLSIRATAEREGKSGFAVADARAGDTVELVLSFEHALALEVVDDIGAPVDEITVWLRYLDELVQGQIDERDGIQKLAAQDGRYSLSLLRAGEWQVMVARRDAAVETALLQKASVPYTGPPLRFELPRFGRVEVHVLDHVGQAVEGAVVRISSVDDEHLMSDETGRAAFENVRAGGHTITAESERLNAEGFVELSPGDTEELELRLEQGGRIEVTVVDASGRPWPARNTILLSGSDVVEGEVTDEDGGAEYESVPAGAYTVAAILVNEQENAGMKENQVFENIVSKTVEVYAGDTVRVELAPKSSLPVDVTGRVTVNGAALAEARFVVFRDGTGLFESLRSFETDEDGRYSVRLDAGGAVLFTLLAPGSSDMPLIVDRIVVPDVRELELDLEVPAGRIEGRVAGATPGCELTLEREDGYLELILPEQDDGVSTQENGTYVFDVVRPGTYTVRVLREAGYTPVSGVVVHAGETVGGVDFERRAGGALRGVAHGPGGRPVRGAGVYLRTSSGALLSAVPTATTGPGGEFTIEALPAGDWTASAHAPGLASRPRRLAIVVGETFELELELEPATEVELRALDEQGEPTSAALRVFDETGIEVSRLLAPAQLAGTFTSTLDTSVRVVGPLPSGRYRATSTTSEGLSASKWVRVEGVARLIVELRP